MPGFSAGLVSVQVQLGRGEGGIGANTVVASLTVFTVNYGLIPSFFPELTPAPIIFSGNVSSNGLIVESDFATTITFTDVVVGVLINTKSTTNIVTFSDSVTGRPVEARTTTNTLTFSDSATSVQITVSLYTNTIIFSDILNSVGIRAASTVNTLLFTDSISAQLIAAAIYSSTIIFPQSFSVSTTEAQTFATSILFNLIFIPESAASVTDPSDVIRIAALQDVHNKFYKTNVMEKTRPLAALESDELIFPQTSSYLEFFVGFINTDVPGILYLERRFADTDSWLTVRTWLVTSSVQFCEQVMSSYTRMRIVNSAAPQTRLTMKADIYGKVLM